MQITHGFGFFPVLELAEKAFRSCRELELVVETKKAVDTVKEVEQFIHLVLDLVGGTDCDK